MLGSLLLPYPTKHICNKRGKNGNTIVKLVGILQMLRHITVCNPQLILFIHSSNICQDFKGFRAPWMLQWANRPLLPCRLHSAENGRLLITQVNKIISDSFQGFEKNKTQLIGSDWPTKDLRPGVQKGVSQEVTFEQRPGQ